MLNLLLQMFAIALIACSVLAIGAYVYASVMNTVSEYRRLLNSGAYNAQMFLNQRETLLRTLAASAIRLTTPPGQLPAGIAANAAPQLVQLPFPLLKKGNDWELVLTPRLLSGVERANARLIFSAPSPNRSYALETANDSMLRWVSREPDLVCNILHFALLPENANHPVVWLRQPGGGERMAVYAPIDRSNTDNGWLGLELRDLHQLLQLQQPLASSYTLIDSHGSVVLQSQDAAHLDAIELQQGDDHFGFSGPGWIPQHIVLSKSIGTGGLRVIYSLPISQLLEDSKGLLYKAALAEIVFIAYVLLGAHALKRLLFVPAQHQYEQLVDSVALNRELITAAPVGLALISSAEHTVLRENPQARDWIAHDPNWTSRLTRPGAQSMHSDVDLDDGRVVHVTSIALTYRGQPITLCTITDVTARKQVETSLIKARQLAEDASRAKTRFLATMSHEIRIPLYGLTGTLELLDMTDISPQQRHYLSTLRRSMVSLRRTVDDSLDLSRIEAGHVELLHQDFCLLELAEEVISAFAPHAQSKGLRIYALVEPMQETRFHGDPQRIRQILDNLISNAVKFTDAGQVVLRIRPLTPLHGEAQILFQVSDTGIGVEAELMPRLFDPYFRTDSAQALHIHGTGLGLAICSNLIQLMHGSLRTISQPGLGTSISFSLPLQPAIAPTGAPALRLEPRPIYVDGLLPDVVNNLCQWLSHWGGLAIAYQGPQQVLSPQGVLVQAWPPSGASPHWSGPRVELQPTPGSYEQAERLTPAYSLPGIAQAVLRAQQESPQQLQLQAPSRRLQHQKLQLGLHLLVVDDSPICQQILQEQLEALHCTAESVFDGRQALDHHALEHFDAVIVDLNMPSMSGYQLAAALRSHGYSKPIVGMTANAWPDPQRQWQTAGMDSLLIKPLNLAMLHEQLLFITNQETPHHA
ncbi:MAG: response regulator [Acidovorax sp.]|jgi:two-component system capsular synthesis sensor histidine kinase RcsC|nr:response regulator [Acidovorax sp.]